MPLGRNETTSNRWIRSDYKVGRRGSKHVQGSLELTCISMSPIGGAEVLNESVVPWWGCFHKLKAGYSCQGL